MQRIYLDHAATTPLDEEVLQKMLPYFTTDFGNADSPHAFGRKAMNAVDLARDELAARIGAKPNEIYFTSGGTESDNWAIFGAAYAQRERGKTRILVSAVEHHACLAAAEKLSKEGFDVVYIYPNTNGVVEPTAVQSAITPETGLVVCMYANNETGVIQPIEKVAAIAHANDALCFTDAVQAAPYLPVNVKKLGVDMLSISSHKFYGPKGCGVLYIRSGVRVQGVIVGGEQERGLRGGTTNVPCVVGCSLAYAKAVEKMTENNAKITSLRKLFLNELKDLDGIRINGDASERVPALLNLQIAGVNNVDLTYAADLQGVSISAGAACASASIKPSHVLSAMGLSEEETRSSVRVSFGKDNTEAEILAAAKILKNIVLRLRCRDDLPPQDTI